MPSKTETQGLPSGEWESLFKKAGVEKDRIEAAKSAKARTTILGNFLAQHVDREVPIEINGKSGTATLRMELGRAKSKRYYFEVRWDKLGNKKPAERGGKKPGGTTRLKHGGDNTPKAALATSTARQQPQKEKRPPKVATGNAEVWE